MQSRVRFVPAKRNRLSKVVRDAFSFFFVSAGNKWMPFVLLPEVALGSAGTTINPCNPWTSPAKASHLYGEEGIVGERTNPGLTNFIIIFDWQKFSEIACASTMWKKQKKKKKESNFLPSGKFFPAHKFTLRLSNSLGTKPMV